MAAAAGLIVGCTAEALTRLPPFIHDLLRQPIAYSGFVMLLVTTLIALGLWSRQPPRLEKGAFVAAVIVAGAIVGITGIVAIRVGWWNGPAFAFSWPVFATLYWFGAMGYVAVIMLPYRWLTLRGYRWSRVAFFVAVLAFIAAATYVGDKLCIKLGIYSFDNGYTIWHDVVYGLAIFSIPFLAYELLRPRMSVLMKLRASSQAIAVPPGTRFL